MAEDGKYLTSFLEIYVDTDKDLRYLALLDDHAQGTYYHEYFHYIQDVTTCSGLSKIWNGFDRLRQLISSIQPAAVTEINAPLDGAVADEQREHLEFLEDLRGSGQIGNISMAEADTYEIAEIRYEENPRILQYYEDSTATAIKLDLTSNGRPNRTFTFGETAISETMAYMIEQKFYPALNNLPRYPYKVAIDVVNHIYPAIAAEGEFVFALCDVSLLYNMPGWAFVSILTAMRDQGFVPQTGEQVIDFGYWYYEHIGWDLFAYLDYADQALQHVSNNIYNHPIYSGTAQLFQASIERGRLLRTTMPYAIVQIYNAQAPLSFEFYRVFNFLGGPVAINNQGDRVVRVPDGLNRLEPISDPAHFRITWQLSKFLMDGHRECKLARSCRANQIPIGVDHRCEHSPWQRVTDEHICAFAAAWMLYRLVDKDIYLNGALIQQRIEPEPGA